MLHLVHTLHIIPMLPPLSALTILYGACWYDSINNYYDYFVVR